jgi:undecaprenyl phosphate N,N'-diacetylbacillosamine 1-phosphate transferase
MDTKVSSVPATFWIRRGKRISDILGGGLLLLLCSPLMLLAAVLIKATSPGAVFFRQMRGGKNGEPFMVTKFRTMRAGRTPDPKELVPLDHPEITRVGHLLRRLKIDELPQLFNVLRGDMSVVGPRPTLLDQIAEYDPVRRQRLLVKPGLTGLAQVYSSAAASWDERISYDIAYVRLCSPLLDLTILVRTVLVILFGEERTARPFISTQFAHTFTGMP